MIKKITRKLKNRNVFWGTILFLAIVLIIGIFKVNKEVSNIEQKSQGESQDLSVISASINLPQITLPELEYRGIREAYDTIIDAYATLEKSGFTEFDAEIIGDTLLATNKEHTYNFGWDQPCKNAIYILSLSAI